jgi:uncharacterized protein (TIGR02996 family)
MTDEDGFLAHLRANPADAVARLAYADWLEEHDDFGSQSKASYLRLDASVAELPDAGPARDKAILAMRKLAEVLPLEWKSAVARLPLENCELDWDFVCPKKWEQLTPTDDPSARHCSACRKTVHYCGSIAEAKEKAWAGECVVVDLQVVRRIGDLNRLEPLLMGRIMPDRFPPEEVSPDDGPTSRGLREWIRRQLRGGR